MRPRTTLFMLMSVDGKISTGDVDDRDIDKDFPKIHGVREGLHQYYDLEKLTDIWSLNTGRVMAKIGANTRKDEPKKLPVNFVIIDNKPHLNKNGMLYLSKKAKYLYIVTTNSRHPAFSSKLENVNVTLYPKTIDLRNLLERLERDYKAKRITIQSGGTMNSSFIREGLIDRVSIVVAPAVVGGKNTSTLVDGESIHTSKDLKKIKALKLVKCRKLKNNYLHLLYDVIN